MLAELEKSADLLAKSEMCFPTISSNLYDRISNAGWLIATTLNSKFVIRIGLVFELKNISSENGEWWDFISTNLRKKKA